VTDLERLSTAIDALADSTPAHCTLTAAVAEIVSRLLGTIRALLTSSSQSATVAKWCTAFRLPAGPAGSKPCTSTLMFWGGLYYSFSTAAGLRLGRQVANYDLHQVFDLPQAH
jgi:hypothetical protein